MSWFPTFLNWPAALVAAALAIPALLVLYFLKLRRREMDVPSTLLWKKAIQDLQVNAPFQKLRRNLLLLLQLLLLGLLLLALSRPVSNYSPGPGKTTVILIDNSASMNARDQEGGRTRLEEAKRRAKDVVAAMGKNATAMVIAFADTPVMKQAFTSDAQLLNQAIDAIEATDRKTSLQGAYQLAEAQVNYNPEQLRPNVEPPDVRLFSDGRVTDNPQDLRFKGKVTFDKIGSDAPGNIAIVALSAKRNYERPTQVQVFARLANYGREPVSAPVELRVDGQKFDPGTADLQTVFLLPESWGEDRRATYERENKKSQRDSVEFRLELTQSAVIRLEQMHKDGDMLPADDVAQVVVPPPKSQSVLLVTDYNFFLELFIKSMDLKESAILRPADYEKDVPTKYDVILFDHYKPPVDPKTKKSKLPEAGNFIWFGAVPEGMKTTVAMEGATTRPGGQAAPGTPVVLDDVGVLDWKRDHPILKDLALNKLFVEQALKLQVPLDREVLVDGLKGPLIVLDREPKQTHLILAFDPMQSTWPLRPSYPLFLYQALQFMSVSSDTNLQSVAPGSILRIPRTNLLKADANLQKIRLKAPNGTSRDVPVPPNGDFVLPPLDRVGIYETDPPIPQFEKIAVNLTDPVESNLVPAEKAPGGGTGDVVETGSAKRRLELWWWLALGALGLLFVEWWVYTRRMHL